MSLYNSTAHMARRECTAPANFRLETLCGIANVIHDTRYDYVVYDLDDFWSERITSNGERCATCALLLLPPSGESDG